MKKYVFGTGVYIAILLIICAFIFIRIASKDPVYSYDVEKYLRGEMTNLICKKDGVKYFYTDYLNNVDVIEERFPLRFNKGSIKKYIKNGMFDSVLDSMRTYLYSANAGMETKYYKDGIDLVVTKCEYDGGYDYYISDKYNVTECNRYDYPVKY